MQTHFSVFIILLSASVLMASDAQMLGGRTTSDPAEDSNLRAASYAVESLNSGHELRKNFVGAEGTLHLVSIKKVGP